MSKIILADCASIDVIAGDDRKLYAVCDLCEKKIKVSVNLKPHPVETH